MTPAQRRLKGRIGAYALHSRGKTNTAPARKAFMDRFSILVDPEGQLSTAERNRRADLARREYFARLALRSALARTRRASGSEPQ